MGYPFFNPPWLQKVNKIEEGNFFVATAGIEPDSVQDGMAARRAKRIQMLKIAVVSIGTIGMLLIGFII